MFNFCVSDPYDTQQLKYNKLVDHSTLFRQSVKVIFPAIVAV